MRILRLALPALALGCISIIPLRAQQPAGQYPAGQAAPGQYPAGQYPTAQYPADPRDPPGVEEAFSGLSSQRAAATTITFDRQMLDALLAGNHIAGFNGVTFEHYQYPEPAFYIPEAMHALEQAYSAAGWKHLVDGASNPRESAQPTRPIADIWFHWQGAEVDHMTVLIRGRREMNVIHVSGLFRPMDIVHLSGHFGIPKVDPNAVMVPAPPGR